ncbi:MAG TPA: hypothetical protein VNO14_15430 [Blastocatellia bacterium]|nr:hypothetical protein [Blastocatellia bacterium]
MAREMVHVEKNTSHAAEPRTEEKLAQLEKILRSRALQGSEILISLLQYLVREAISNPYAQLKEYTIATTVLGRSADFDPRIDSVVRVQVKRLRSKLQEYYKTEGKSDKILIDLPKGHYRVVFSYIQKKEEAAPSTPSRVETLPVVRRDRLWRSALIGCIIILSVAVVLLAFSNISLRRQAQTERPSVEQKGLGPVWEPFLNEGARTLVVLSNPPLYRFSNNSDPQVLLKRSMEIAPEHSARLAEELRDKLVMKQSPTPRLILSSEDYTGMGEAIGLFHLTQMFQSAGEALLLKQSRTISPEDLKNHNVILLGSAWVNEWVEKLPVKEDFSYSPDATIQNNNPLPGEERQYRPKYNEQNGEVESDYALITVKPGVTDKRRLMILAGLLSEGTQGAAEYVTRSEYLSTLNQRLLQLAGEAGPPKYYQALLKVDVENGIPTTVSLLALHPLKVTRN